MPEHDWDKNAFDNEWENEAENLKWDDKWSENAFKDHHCSFA